MATRNTEQKWQWNSQDHLSDNWARNRNVDEIKKISESPAARPPVVAAAHPVSTTTTTQPQTPAYTIDHCYRKRRRRLPSEDGLKLKRKVKFFILFQSLPSVAGVRSLSPKVKRTYSAATARAYTGSPVTCAHAAAAGRARRASDGHRPSAPARLRRSRPRPRRRPSRCPPASSAGPPACPASAPRDPRFI